MTVGLRPRPRHGPALRRLPIPVVPLALSALVHGVLAAAVVVGALLWKTSQPRTYVVNLVPAVPAVGTPAPPPRPQPATPPRAPEPPPPPAPARTAPERPVVRTVPARPATPERPVVRDLPERAEAPELPPPPSARDLPTREMPLREVARPPEHPAPPALTRPGIKEPPTLPAPAPRPVTTPAPPAVASTPLPAPALAPTTRPPAPLPPPPVGRPTGSPQGSGALSLDPGDFPFVWYLRTIETKITERWTPPPGSREGQQVVVVFEIGRDGRASNVRLEKPSGNAAYDLAALRAIADASPFPPLPAEFKEPLLRVHLGFHYTDRG